MTIRNAKHNDDNCWLRRTLSIKLVNWTHCLNGPRVDDDPGLIFIRDNDGDLSIHNWFCI